MALDVLHNWALVVAVDGLIDDGARSSGRTRRSWFTAPTLDSLINWDTPGRVRHGRAPRRTAPTTSGSATARAVPERRATSTRSSFQGATTLPTGPSRGRSTRTRPVTPGDPALYSGAANNRDEAIVRSIAVPSGAARRSTFDALWNEETGWDFGFVQVSTDGGATYKVIACTDTTTATRSRRAADREGERAGLHRLLRRLESRDVQPVGLRRPDGAAGVPGVQRPGRARQPTGGLPPGFWVDDVRVGGTLDLATARPRGWQSFTRARPNTVAGFTVTIISIDTKEARSPSGSSRSRATSRSAARRTSRSTSTRTPTSSPRSSSTTIRRESSTQYAPYRLTVNGVVQPGGA